MVSLNSPLAGMLHVNMSGFSLDSDTNITSLESVLGFSIDKTVSDTLNPYIENTDYSCILDKTLEEKEKAGIIRFILDFKNNLVRVKCSNNVKSITILDKEQEKATGGALSDEGLFNRPKREAGDDNYSKRKDKDSDIDNIFGSPLQREIEAFNKEEEESRKGNENEVMVSSTTAKVSMKESHPVKETIKGSIPVHPHPGPVHAKVAQHPKSPEPTETTINIPLKLDENGQYQTSFYIYILNEKLEGLYSMFFHNCLNYPKKLGGPVKKEAVSFRIEIEEKNTDSYLSAGEMPLPALYQMLAILFFLSGCFWVFILKKTGSQQVFRIHWIMASLVFLKSLSLFFHGVNYNKIATQGNTWTSLT